MKLSIIIAASFIFIFNSAHAAGDKYPLSQSGKKCSDSGKATITTKTVLKKSADGYIFEAKFKSDGRVEEFTAWSKNLSAKKLGVGDNVCLESDTD